MALSLKNLEANLALPSSNVPLVLQNPNSFLVTSLPYIDMEDDPKILAQVEKLLKEEMSKMPKIDYLENYPMPELNFGSSELLKNEYENIESGREIEEVDFALERLEDISPEADDDINAIKTAVDKCDMISQYNNVK